MTAQSHSQSGEPETAPSGGALLSVFTVILAVVAALQALLFLMHSWGCILFPYQLDYGEGPILQIALRVARGEEMYPTALTGYPYVIASYMPGYYLLSALGVRIAGPSFLAGRLISCLGTLTIALCAALMVWEWTKHRFASFLAGAIILALPQFLVWGNLMRVDVPAHAFSLAGFYLFQRGRRKAGLLAMALGVFTRRTNIAAIAATVAGVWIKCGWRAALRVAVVQGLLIAGLLGASLALTRGGLYQQLSWHTASSVGGAWTWQQVWLILSVAVREWPAYFLLAAAGAIWCVLKPERRALFVYFAVSGGLFLTVGRIGSSQNYLLEPLAVGAIMTGVLWADLSRRVSRLRPILLLVAGILALQWIWTDLHLPHTISLLRPEASPTSGRLVVDRIAAAGGPVLCEDVGLNLLAGEEVPIQPFEFTQMAKAGVLDPTPVYEDARQGRFPLIVLRFNPRDIQGHGSGEDWVCGRWPDGIISAVMEHYRLDDQQVPPYLIYVPRGNTEAESSLAD